MVFIHSPVFSAGVPLPDVSEKGSLWPSVKETLLSGVSV